MPSLPRNRVPPARQSTNNKTHKKKNQKQKNTGARKLHIADVATVGTQCMPHIADAVAVGTQCMPHIADVAIQADEYHQEYNLEMRREFEELNSVMADEINRKEQEISMLFNREQELKRALEVTKLQLEKAEDKLMEANSENNKLKSTMTWVSRSVIAAAAVIGFSCLFR